MGEQQNKSWCCRVVSHESPTTENWKEYFIGYTNFKEYAWSALEPGQKIDVLSIPALEGEVREVTALLPGDEPRSFEQSYHQEAKSSTKLVAQGQVHAGYEPNPSRGMTILADEPGDADDVGF